MADLLLRCVPDPALGAGTPPCPAGHIVVVLDTNLPEVVALGDFGFFAASSAGLVIACYVAGLGVGWVVSMMKGTI